MRHHVYTVHDSKAQAFTQPFFAVNSRVAVRMFTQLANDPEHLFCLHAEDFTLIELGEFDDQNGLFDLLPVSETIGKAIQYQREENRFYDVSPRGNGKPFDPEAPIERETA